MQFLLNTTKRNKRISSIDVEMGFNKRDIEKICAEKGPLKAIPFIERIEPQTPEHYAICFCMLIEKAVNKECNDKINSIRTIFLELERILCHITHLGRLFYFSGNRILHNTASSIKESMIDLKEEITGHRLYSSIHSFYELNLHLSSGNLKQAEKVCIDVENELKEIRSIFADNKAVGSIYNGLAQICRPDTYPELSGPASWIYRPDNDRRFNGYLGYAKSEIKEILKNKYVSEKNTAANRIDSVISDLKNSIQIIKILTNMDGLTHKADSFLVDDIRIPAGNYEQKIETPMGHLDMAVTIGDSNDLKKIKISSPSDKNIKISYKAMKGVLADYTQPAWESLYISPMEIDK
ncbi:MAG: hypothetical protein V1647_03820 [Pseudomonadota bacterium]